MKLRQIAQIVPLVLSSTLVLGQTGFGSLVQYFP